VLDKISTRFAKFLWEAKDHLTDELAYLKKEETDIEVFQRNVKSWMDAFKP